MASTPKDTPEQAAEVDSIRSRLFAHKTRTKLSWEKLAEVIGIAAGTLSSFGVGTYAGNNARVAEQVAKWFDSEAQQALVAAIAPKVPGYVETPFAAQVVAAFRFAQSGEIVAIAAGPGCGKTITAKHYRRLVPNVWLATMTKSCARLQPMQIQVLRAMGIDNPKGSPQQLSSQIIAKLANSHGLLIIDEFHELTDDAVEEIRSWHDATDVGMAFVGDYRVIASIEGRKDRRSAAQIFSRVTHRVVENGARVGDADVLLDAWGVSDEASRKFARVIATKPGALRSMTKMLKLAHFVRDPNAAGITVDDLRSARGQLTSTLEA